MTKFVSVQTQGFSELKNLFQNLPAKVEDQVLSTGVIAGARFLAGAARKAAPRNTKPLSPTAKAAHEKYGTLRSAVKAKLLKKKVKNVRAAIVNRGGAFWGDFVNRGTRYIPASYWYDAALAQAIPTAMEQMRRYMVAKVTQVSLKAIQQYGANKR